MTDWHVGMQVVCVDDGGILGEIKPIEARSVYTIRSIVTCPLSGAIGFYLEEVVNFDHPIVQREYGYADWRFRPVRKINIDCFLSLLNNTPTEREVAATTSLPGVSSLPDDLPHERACQLAKRHHRIPSAAFSQRPNLAPDLPFLVDGRVPLLHPSVPSGVSSSCGSEKTTGTFADAQKVFDRSSNV